MSDGAALTEILLSRLNATKTLIEATQGDDALIRASVEAARLTAHAINQGGTLFICGNGGSAGEATHLSGELIGPFANKTRRALPAVALGFDTSAASAVANDFSFSEVFARQLSALARPGDVLWALSTSGRSPNIRRVLEVATERGVTTVLLTGAKHPELPRADLVLAVPSRETPRIQELHLVLGHFLCEIVESLTCPE
ncbi:D-sedoheptulose-7-phosphate isomerase [Thiocystis violacea]|uniref:D-sedoheptulose-7-phosphate isomerase n=1 Tax=Thiocystis violacea TaxID=13725 RepID=UPI0019045D56|nr:SIS domain-containing protein [Thiocystis violacea]MBK1725017.1 sugar isomerase [Thiocystis violacea]